MKRRERIYRDKDDIAILTNGFFCHPFYYIDNRGGYGKEGNDESADEDSYGKKKNRCPCRFLLRLEYAVHTSLLTAYVSFVRKVNHTFMKLTAPWFCRRAPLIQ